MTHTAAPLTLFNSLTRALEPFVPVHPGEARVYSCGPTVYNYPHIGNMRAYVFADVLGHVVVEGLQALTHVINITDVGHLTDDADAGEDKLEKAAKAGSQSIWDIARTIRRPIGPTSPRWAFASPRTGRSPPTMCPR
jgi:cysteinyl-tRNA synthetase